MIHLGDITKIHSAPFVHCVTFGSPCQDLSIAGKRAGLAGERSGLFIEAVRIIKEMREQSGGVYPTFAVWENVPGAFSSNKGEDFRAVLEELAHIKEPEVSVPRPKNGKWAKAGFIAGNGWSVAWRTLDAKFWGVPQRRKRIALVVDFGGQRAGEILFERTGVRRDSEPSIPPWQGVARNPAHCAAGHDRVVEGEGNCLTPWDGQSRRIYEASGKWPAIYAGEGGGHGYVISENPACYTLKIRSGRDGGGKGALVGVEKASAVLANGERDYLFSLQGNMIDREARQNGSGIAESETVFTLNATDRHGVCCAADMYNARLTGEITTALTTASNQGACNTGPTVLQCAAFTAGQGAKANGIGCAEEQAPTLKAADCGSNRSPTVLCRAQANTNAETYENLSPTLTTCHDGPPIVFVSHSQDARYTQQDDTSSACTAQPGTGGNNMPLVVRKILLWIIRHLTPTECERLQGFPDGWTDIGEWIDSKGKRHKTADSPRCKALGNSIALPQWWWITCKMARYLPERATLGSLFDGIGGFPLVWETLHGKGTAVWASEIEEFPIAVTKVRFS